MLGVVGVAPVQPRRVAQRGDPQAGSEALEQRADVGRKAPRLLEHHAGRKPAWDAPGIGRQLQHAAHEPVAQARAPDAQGGGHRQAPHERVAVGRVAAEALGVGDARVDEGRRATEPAAPGRVDEGIDRLARAQPLAAPQQGLPQAGVLGHDSPVGSDGEHHARAVGRLLEAPAPGGQRARTEAGVDRREDAVEARQDALAVLGPALAQHERLARAHPRTSPGAGTQGWRERMGIEPTGPAVHETQPALKAGRHTSTDPLPFVTSSHEGRQVEQARHSEATSLWRGPARELDRVEGWVSIVPR